MKQNGLHVVVYLIILLLDAWTHVVVEVELVKHYMHIYILSVTFGELNTSTLVICVGLFNVVSAGTVFYASSRHFCSEHECFLTPEYSVRLAASYYAINRVIPVNVTNLFFE